MAYRKFTAHQKSNAVFDYLRRNRIHGWNKTSVARNHGCTVRTLNKWVYSHVREQLIKEHRNATVYSFEHVPEEYNHLTAHDCSREISVFRHGDLAVIISNSAQYHNPITQRSSNKQYYQGWSVWVNDDPPSGFNQGRSSHLTSLGEKRTRSQTGWESDRYDYIWTTWDFEEALDVATRYLISYMETHEDKKSANYLAAQKSVSDHDWSHDGMV